MDEKNILVVGGGISGITTSVEIAEVGLHNVILIDKQPYLGGRVARMNQYFPKLCPPYCGLEINFRRIKQNPRIKFYTSTTVDAIRGAKGDFNVTLTTQPTYVNDNCTVCGNCEEVCPVERPDEYNYGLTNTKAIYLPHEMAFPWKYAIDDTVCTKSDCKKCVEVCKYDAIDLEATPKTCDLSVASIVFATGWEPYNTSKIDYLKYGVYPDVITNVMMERIGAANGPTKGKILRPSDQKPPKEIAFVQCAGSRDENHLPYCSSVCCLATMKQALNFRTVSPEGKVKIFYIDLRALGRNEDVLVKVQADENIELIKGKVAQIEENAQTKRLTVEAEDIMSGAKSKAEADMVVLAAGMVPTLVALDEIQYDDFGFLNLDSLDNGILAAGCSRKPLDVSASVKDSTGAALKAIQFARW